MKIVPGMKFVYQKKHSEGSSTGTVLRVYIDLLDLPFYGKTLFECDKGLLWKASDVKWLDDIRDDKLNELGI